MNRHHDQTFFADDIIQAWRAQLARAATTPWLARVLLRQPRTLFTRFSAAYRYVLSLSRQRRRKLLRNMGVSLAGAAMVLALSHGAVQAADIAVNGKNPNIQADGECSLIEAIVNANEDGATYADCAAGNGDDTIVLGGKTYALKTVNNVGDHGPNGLPVISSSITIEGNHALIIRNENAPEFRIFEVTESGDLTINDTTISGGYLSDAYLGPLLGYAYGAGIYNNGGIVTLTNSTVSDNAVVIIGGGIFNTGGGEVTLMHSTVSGNSSEDDGAGIYNAEGKVALINSTVSGNDSQDGEAGGLFNEIDQTITLFNSTVSGNHAGQGGGGISSDGILEVRNSTITQNNTEGDGGGIRTRVSSFSTFEHSIVSGNTALGSGSEIFSGYTDLGIVGTITADAYNLFGNSSQSTATAIATFDPNLFVFTPGVTDIVATSDGTHPTALTAILDPVLQNNGGATATHALVSDSPALDAAPAGPDTDQRGMTRPRATTFDIGAFELLIPPTVNQVYLSSFRTGTVGGVHFKDEDILAHNLNTGEWSMLFDGSDVGLSHTDVDAFYLMNDGSILMSFDQSLLLPPLGRVDDADILRFVPSRLGNRTAGNFETYFDGSDAGLELGGEDIDAIAFTPDGRLLISTNGKFIVDDLTAHDEDLVAFTAESMGTETRGAWSLYLNGSDLGLNEDSEDLSSAWNYNSDLYLTTKGKFQIFDGVTEVKGDGETIFAFTPFTTGEDTTGLIFDFFDENLLDFERSIDGLSLDLNGAIAANLNALQSTGVEAAAVDTVESEQFALAPDEAGAETVDEELNAYDSEVEAAETTGNNQIFLPLIQH